MNTATDAEKKNNKISNIQPTEIVSMGTGYWFFVQTNQSNMEKHCAVVNLVSSCMVSPQLSSSLDENGSIKYHLVMLDANTEDIVIPPSGSFKDIVG